MSWHWFNMIILFLTHAENVVHGQRLSTFPQLLEITVMLLKITSFKLTAHRAPGSSTRSHIFAGLYRKIQTIISCLEKYINMNVLIVFAQCFLWQFTNSYTTYDQRQNGPWNLDIDVKNVNIFSLMKGNKEEYVDYDYAYDYSEMTIKPPNGTRPKPTNSITTSTENLSVITQNMVTEGFTDAKINTTTDVYAEVVMATLHPTNYSITGLDASFTTNSTADVTTPIPSCKKGFKQNSKGDCELELHGTTNALRKLVKLSQKIKWRRANHQQPSSNQDGSV